VTTFLIATSATCTWWGLCLMALRGPDLLAAALTLLHRSGGRHAR
jgi:hypothetical protein